MLKHCISSSNDTTILFLVYSSYLQAKPKQAAIFVHHAPL